MITCLEKLNANEICIEAPLHIYQNCFKKLKIPNAGEIAEYIRELRLAGAGWGSSVPWGPRGYVWTNLLIAQVGNCSPEKGEDQPQVSEPEGIFPQKGRSG